MVLLIGLVGCNEKKLLRIDYQKGKNRSEENKIVDENEIKTIERIMSKVEWENAKVEMTRKEDVMLTFFYQLDPNEPEKLEEYRIWFNQDMNTGIVDSNQNRHGELDESDAVKLKEFIK
ncbi:hypothetical protein KUV80_08045 [Fictibacillus nanhaiensis]|uniref:hypothetical protein n=1 Tax=Fictibacillus nanhaiensis TaxID=742169 RepID=UPI001C97A998|nr:hypothetical protein [Fictibacillus nanhaiensis]MBY6036600.1 hypothetical protein [Fictibacillus nanhaiensis]